MKGQLPYIANYSGRFDEDGSFIGLYGGRKGAKATTASDQAITARMVAAMGPPGASATLV